MANSKIIRAAFSFLTVLSSSLRPKHNYFSPTAIFPNTSLYKLMHREKKQKKKSPVTTVRKPIFQIMAIICHYKTKVKTKRTNKQKKDTPNGCKSINHKVIIVL